MPKGSGSVGDLFLTLRGDTSKLGKDISKGIKSARRSLNAGVKTMAASLAVGGAAAAAFARSGLKSADALAKMSDQSQVATEKVQAYRLAMELAGGTSQGLDKSIVQMNKNIGFAVRDGGTMAKTFESIGLKGEELARMGTDEAFESIGEAISKLPTAAQKSAAALGIFGRQGREMLTLFKDGREGIESAKKDIEELGLTLSRVDAAKVEIANDQLARLKLVLRGASQTFAVELAPVISGVADLALKAIKDMGGFKSIFTKIVDWGIAGFAHLGDAVRGWQLLIKQTQVAVTSVFANFPQITFEVLRTIEIVVGRTLHAINGLVIDVNRSIGTKLNTISYSGFGLAKFESDVKLFSEAAQISLAELRQQLNDLINKPLPTQAITDWANNVREKVDQAATEIATRSQKLLAPGAGTEGDFFSSENNTALESLRQSLLTEEEAIKKSYEDRKQIILDATRITGEDRADLLNRLEADHSEQVRQLELQRWKTALSAFDSFQDNLLTLARTGNKELASVFKAAAIFNTLVKTYESATSAYAAMAPIPFVGPVLGAAAAGAAVAAGLANVSAIRSQQPSFDGGGFTGVGSRSGGVDGKGGFNAILHPNETVIDHTKSGGGVSGDTIVNVHNYGNSQVETEERQEGNRKFMDIFIDRFKRKEFPAAIQSGGNEISRALEGTYGLKRGGA